ncbi:MAG: ATP-binding protein [Nocardioidaceae bacterium]|nr:ATP-binding protein [Nocardioidaceae bacterium]
MMALVPRQGEDDVESELRVRFAAHPASVPGARRFVADGLRSWGRRALVEDAAVCVTELSANAALHSGSRYFDVSVQGRPESVRVCVEDQGTVPASAVVARTGVQLAERELVTTNGEAVGAPGARDEPVLSLLDDEPTTGRGLVIVAHVASAWGVDETPAGKRIWAELRQPDDAAVPDGAGLEYAEPVRRPPPHHDPATQPAIRSDELPVDWRVVRLANCPVRLSLRQDDHLDELIRELQLIDTDPDNRPSARLAGVIETLLQRGAHARHNGRRAAQDAAAAGLDLIDIDMPVPIQLVEDVKELHRVVTEADRLCDQRELLTLTSTAEVRSVRSWMVHEFVRQIEHDEPPTDYASWSAAS